MILNVTHRFASPTLVLVLMLMLVLNPFRWFRFGAPARPSSTRARRGLEVGELGGGRAGPQAAD